MDRKWLSGALKDIATFGQMGMYVVVPPVILAMLAIWLQKKFSIGAWIIIVGIILGLLSAFTSIYKLCMGFMYKQKKKDSNGKIVSFRRHE